MIKRGLGTHGYLMAQRPQTLCTLCNTPITIKHLFSSCPLYSIPLNRFNLPPNLSQLLSDSSPHLTNLFLFLRLHNLLPQI
ncbi:hypothetical protein O3M35_006456 [Rhynocoris fuscipes]|uniref:Reverse transcriptase zinc-binding domain-containing protein n=1 Tax=Rhynocoris fuscipes TaxID=488301 RepID=A0AAW1DKU8_9HEMI